MKAPGRIMVILLLAFTVPTFLTLLSTILSTMSSVVDRMPLNATVVGSWGVAFEGLVRGFFRVLSDVRVLAVIFGLGLILGMVLERG